MHELGKLLVLAGLLLAGAGVSVARLNAATVEERVAEFGDAVRERLAPRFRAAGASYPPGRLVLVGLKDERRLEVYAPGPDGGMRCVVAYPVLGASGGPGPKLREGDLQVPEGLYRIESLNPNSAYHLALRVDYPNAFDRARAAKESRANLGGDIMIHGGDCSIGCLAMGDEAAEDLFVLGALTGAENIRVILAPADFRMREWKPDEHGPAWVAGLYDSIRAALAELPVPPASLLPRDIASKRPGWSFRVSVTICVLASLALTLLLWLRRKRR